MFSKIICNMALYAHVSRGPAQLPGWGQVRVSQRDSAQGPGQDRAMCGTLRLSPRHVQCVRGAANAAIARGSWEKLSDLLLSGDEKTLETLLQQLYF